jgi:hypothetical protein
MIVYNSSMAKKVENSLECTAVSKRQSRYLDLRADKKESADEKLVPCVECSRVRVYTKYDVARGRVSDLCQPCAVRKYNSKIVKKTKEQKKKYYADWYQRNKDKTAKYLSEYREKIRLEMIEAYGGKCQKCGESDPIVLVLDHINDNAAQEKARNKHNGGYKMYFFLRRNGWPKDEHQLMCHNCNFRKEYIRRKNAVKNR